MAQQTGAKHKSRVHNPKVPLALNGGKEVTQKKKKKNAASGSGTSPKENTSPKKTNTSTKPKTNTAPKHNKKTKKHKSNGVKSHFAGLGNAAKSTLVGTAGAFGSRVGADLGLSVVGNIMPNVEVARSPYARPLVTAAIALFAMNHVGSLIGLSRESQATARMGGLIAAGLDGLEIVAPNAQAAITGRFRMIADRVHNAGAMDARAVATNSRTALAPAQAIAAGAANGAAATALDAGLSPAQAQTVATNVAAVTAQAMSGLGYAGGGDDGGDDMGDDFDGDF